MPDWFGWLGMGFGLIGTGLGVWTRVEKLQENRSRRLASMPLVIAEYEGQVDGWRRLTIIVRAQSDEPYRVETISSSDAQTMFTSSRYEPYSSSVVIGIDELPDPSRAERVLTVGKRCDRTSPEVLVETWVRSDAPELRIIATCRSIASNLMMTSSTRNAILINAIAQKTSTDT